MNPLRRKNQKKKLCTTAAVIWDHEGVFLAAHARWFGSVNEALVAEVLAAWDDMVLVMQMAASHVILANSI
jgi:hypothetical protein